LHGNVREAQLKPFTLAEGRYEFRVNVRLPIKAGLYQIDVRLYSETGGPIESALLEPKLHVLPSDSGTPPQWEGLVTEPLEFSIHETP